MEYFFNFEKIAYLKGKRPEGCILCLVRDRDPAVTDLTVYREEDFTVCLNLYPYNPGHLLVFPHRHIADLRDLSPPEWLRLQEVLKMALDVLTAEYNPAGFNVGCNMGLSAGASIEHLHYHIIPRYPREIGIAELLAGKRVLVEHPLDTKERLMAAFKKRSSPAKERL